MLKRLIAGRLAAFERRYGYDMSYARMLLNTRLRAFLRFAELTKISQYHDGIALSPWYAAKLAATLHEDCGPCTQLVIRMAQEAGVAPAVVRAILARDFAELEPDVALALRYAEAVLSHAPELDSLRAEAQRRWGDRGLVSLALGIASSRMFPTLKYALGFAHDCAVLEVNGEQAPFKRAIPVT
jgi:alkylhydroperoxidase family enzyme